MAPTLLLLSYGVAQVKINTVTKVMQTLLSSNFYNA